MYDVLLVDDEEIFLQFMEQAIDWEQYGCRICACREEGEGALEYITANRPDIVFIDISIPRLTGLEVCERVRALDITSKLVITTAHDEFSFAYKAIKLDIDEYLLKPFSEKELETTLLKMLSQLHTPGAAEAGEAGPEATAGSRVKYGKDREIIARIDACLFAHYHEPGLTVENIADRLQYESSYLRRVYKRNTGMTISQKLDVIRVRKAKELLATNKYLNREIALAVGFSDQYYFSKRFKQLCGSNPSAYR
jgi:two-component system response regulator YesN